MFLNGNLDTMRSNMMHVSNIYKNTRLIYNLDIELGPCLPLKLYIVNERVSDVNDIWERKRSVSVPQQR